MNQKEKKNNNYLHTKLLNEIIINGNNTTKLN